MLFAPVDPGVRDEGKFGTYVHYSPPTLSCRLFPLFLEGFYNAVALIKFGKPIDKELVSEFGLSTINPKTDKELETLFVISKDGQEKSIIEDFYSSIQVKNKFTIGCLLNSAEVHALVRRAMRKLFDDVKISEQEIADIMVNNIIKREIIDSEESKKAKRRLIKYTKN
jgi:hypothetical protein